MATTTHGDLAADAAAYLAKSARTNESLSGSQKEIRRQADSLVEWAQERGVLLTENYIAGLEKHEGVFSEHEVFWRASDNRAVKRTYPGTYGYANGPKGKQRQATPLFYLHRLKLMNKEFGGDLRLEGVTFGKPRTSGDESEKPSIIISQGWIDAVDGKDPHPTEQEIEDFMVALGFSRLDDSCYRWRRETDGVVVFDTKPDNFIRSASGVVPIDLLIGKEISEKRTR